MKIKLLDDAVFRVALDDVTIARVLELADVCHTDPASVIASIVHDVLEDDALAHMPDTREVRH